MKTLTRTTYIIVMLCLMASQTYAQDYFIETTFPLSGIDRFSVCGGEKTITVKLTNTSGSTLTNDTLSFDLPVGFDYSAGSLSGAGITEVDTIIPSFAFTNVAPSGVVEFSINVEVLCSGIANATGSANTTFDINLKYTGGGGSQNYTSTFFEVVKPTLSIIDVDGKTPNKIVAFNAAKYNSETKCVTVANGGNGPLQKFEYWIIDHPQLGLDSITIAGYGNVPATNTSGDTTFFMINSAMIASANPYTGSGADPNDLTKFQFNETLVLCEHWTVTDCGLNPPDLERGVQYRCQATYGCEFARVLQGVRFGYTKPDLKLGWHNDLGDDYPVCTGDTLHKYSAYMTNIGTEGATNLRFSIYVGADNRGGMFLDTSTIVFSNSRNGPYYKHEIAYTEKLSGISAACLASAGSEAENIRRANFFMEDLILMPGDTLFMDFGYRVGCNCGDLNRTDQCSKIENSRDFRRLLYGFYEPGGVNNGGDITYDDACEQFSYTDRYIQKSALYYYFNTAGEGEGATLGDGESSSVLFQGTRNISTNAYSSSYFNCQDCYTEYLYIFPAGLDWSGTTGDLNTSNWSFQDYNGDRWYPTMVTSTSHPTGLDTLIIRLDGGPPSGFSMNANSFFNLDYTVDCSEVACGFYSGVPIKEETYFSLNGGTCGTCGPQGDQVDCQESVPVTFYCTCPGGCSEGIVFKSLDAERRTFGKADDNNNTITDAGETLDTTKLLLNRVMPGDTVKTTFKGELRATSFTGFDYAFAEIIFPNTISDFQPVSANIKIYDVSTSTIITCNVLQQFIDGNKIVTNLSSANLKTLGCTSIPTGWQYENGDSLTVEVAFMTKTNVGGKVVPLVYNTNFYVSDQDYGGTKYQCNPRDFLLSHVGYQFYHSKGSRYSLKGCNVGYLDTDHRMRMGSNWSHRSAPDYFPYEVREPFLPKIQTFINQSDLAMTGVVKIYYYPLLVNNPGKYNVNYFKKTTSFADPNITVLGDTVIVDVKAYLDANAGDGISYDQGFYLRVYVQVQGNCTTELSSSYNKLYTYDINSTSDPRITGTPTYDAKVENVQDVRMLEKANLAIQVTPQTKQVIENPTCFTLDLVNAGSATADNVYWAFNDFNGSVIVESLYETTSGQNTLITPTAFGLYQIGTTNSGKTRTFDLCVSSNNCALDSLEMSTGWDCAGYPTSLEEAQCGESRKVYLLPIRSELGMVISKPLQATTKDLCDIQEYEVTLSSADLGSLNDITLLFKMPDKMTYVPGSMKILYPVSGSYTATIDPTNIGGTTYQIAVSDLHPTLAATGLPGTIQIGQNLVKLKFEAKTECNYTSGSRIRFLSYAFDPCGQFANYRISPAPPHFISGTSTPFSSNISLQDLELNACTQESTTLDISMNLASASQAIGAGDSVRVILPEGMRYVPNSYAPISNATTNAPYIETINGNQIIYIDLVDGTLAGSSSRFTIDLQAYDVGQDCRDYDLTVQAFNSQPGACGAKSCTVRVLSSETTKNITIEKPSYLITWQSIQSTPLTATTTELIYSVGLENITGVDLTAATGVSIEIYSDDDGNGRFSSGDTKLGTSLFSVDIAGYQTLALSDTLIVSASGVCNLLAVINPETTCACSEDETFLLDAKLNNVFDRDEEVCSNGTLNFGPVSVTAYTYEWFGINGADLSALNSSTTTPVQFSYDNNTGNNVTWEYVLRTTKGFNCYSYDTMKVTIYPEIDESVTVGTCVGFPVNLNAPAGTTGNWTPTTNLTDPNDPNTSVVGITQTTIYTWTYTTPRGCDAYFRQTVALTGCSQRTMIGDYVWRDDNRNGIQDNTDVPLFNVPVYLYDADNTDVPLATVYTDINGYYEFKPIPAGNYRVGFGNIYDYDPSPQDQGNDDELDSDMDPTTFVTEPILVANGDSITTIDAGFMPMQLVGDYVWSDLDSNGVQDNGELPIEGVTVNIYKTNGTLVNTATTDANGKYQFRVEPDDYYITFNVTTNKAGINYVPVPINNSGDPATDSDANALGKTANFTVTAGQDDLKIDAGFKGVEDCSNGIDDDSDGLIDCADSDCQPVISAVVPVAPSCDGGGNDGQITITASGSGSLEYSINNSPVWQTSPIFSTLGMGQYTIRVRNNGTCIATHSTPIVLDFPTCKEICDDLIDNDGDGFIDCDDPDCENKVKGKNGGTIIHDNK